MNDLNLWRSCGARVRASLGPISLSVICVALASTACLVRDARPDPVYVQADPAPVAYVDVDAPIGIETYPTTVYDGHPVYYYQDHWYYRNGSRWSYYRAEPPLLYQHRSRTVMSRPVEHREEHREEVHHEEPHHEEHREEAHHEEHR